MTRFAVWAPVAGAVDLLVGGADPVPMQRAARSGWWEADVADAGRGVDYAFSLDGSEPLADPCSPWQPGGIDGWSRVVDHSRFPWTDHAWRGRSLAQLGEGAIYELHVGTFTPEGTFVAAIDRLDHLVDLGVRAIELMPVNEFSGDRGWGYDGVFLFAPHHAYGRPGELKRLVDAAHARGLAVLLDVVYNHLGPAGNVLERYGPYFTTRHSTPWGKAVNFDGPDSDQVREFFIRNAQMWLVDYHLDGLRLDAVHAIVDQSAIHFLEHLSLWVQTLAESLEREMVVVAENDLNDPRLARPPALGGYGLDGMWNEDFHHGLHALLTGERQGYYQDFGSLGDVAACLGGGFVYDGRYSEFRRKLHGRPATGLPGRAFVGFLQNHDQVGNRALGDRAGALMSPGRLKVGAALVTMAPFVPMLFQGEEWGASTPFLYFTDHRDPDLGRAVREGRRREFVAFGWDPEQIPDPQDAATFARSKLVWDEASTPPHAEILAWYRQLLQLRRTIPDLADDRMDAVEASCSEEAGWLRMRRGRAEVVANVGRSAAVVAVSPAMMVLLASDPLVDLAGSALTLPPDSVAILGNGVS